MSDMFFVKHEMQKRCKNLEEKCLELDIEIEKLVDNIVSLQDAIKILDDPIVINTLREKIRQLEQTYYAKQDALENKSELYMKYVFTYNQIKDIIQNKCSHPQEHLVFDHFDSHKNENFNKCNLCEKVI